MWKNFKQPCRHSYYYYESNLFSENYFWNYIPTKMDLAQPIISVEYRLGLVDIRTSRMRSESTVSMVWQV